MCFGEERQGIPREGRRIWEMWKSSKINFILRFRLGMLDAWHQ